jgi:hypothetical protein
MTIYEKLEEEVAKIQGRIAELKVQLRNFPD